MESCKDKLAKKVKELHDLKSGLISKIGRITFVIGFVLVVTILINFFKPLLINRFFFHYLIAQSICFATLTTSINFTSQIPLLTKENKRGELN